MKTIFIVLMAVCCLVITSIIFITIYVRNHDPYYCKTDNDCSFTTEGYELPKGAESGCSCYNTFFAIFGKRNPLHDTQCLPTFDEKPCTCKNNQCHETTALNEPSENYTFTVYPSELTLSSGTNGKVEFAYLNTDTRYESNCSLASCSCDGSCSEIKILYNNVTVSMRKAQVDTWTVAVPSSTTLPCTTVCSCTMRCNDVDVATEKFNVTWK